MSGTIIVLIIVIAVVVIFKFFPGIIPENWKVRSSQEAMKYAFRLQEGEHILHQTTGIFDPNAHLSMSESVKENIKLSVISNKQLTQWQSISMVITDRNRFIISYDSRVEPIIFEKTNLPKIIDTGKTARRVPEIPPLFRYPGTSGACRMIEIVSEDIPDSLIPDNTGKFEVNTPVEFIATLLNWLKGQAK